MITQTPPRKVLRGFQAKAQTRAFYNKISRIYDLLADRSEAPVRRAVMMGADDDEKEAPTAAGAPNGWPQ